MDRNESIQKIKEIMKNLMFSETVEVKLSDIKLQDGTIIQSPDSEIKVGSLVTDSTGAPCADGEYVLEDGTNVTVLNGAVSEVEAPVEEQQEEEGVMEDANVNANVNADAVTETPAEDEVKDSSITDGLDSRISSLESQITEVLDILKQQGSMNSQMMSKIKAIGDEPGDEPVKNKTKVFETFSKERKIFEDSIGEIEKIREFNKQKMK